MDAEPGGILYLQEFFSDSVNEITFRITRNGIGYYKYEYEK
jgi:hypothetical protein